MTENSSEKDNNKLRFFDDDGYRPRAACICIRDENEDQVSEKRGMIEERFVFL